MVDIVIGDERSNLTLSVPDRPRLYSAARLEIFDAEGSFRVEGFSGAFKTQLSAPIVRQFAHDLIEFVDGSRGGLKWWGGIDHVPDFEIELQAKADGGVNANTSFSVGMLSATAQAYGLQSSEWSFQGTLYFKVDGNALERAAIAVNTLRFEARQ